VELGACAGWGDAEPGGAVKTTPKVGKCDQLLVTAIPGTEDRNATARESAGFTEQRDAGMPTQCTGYPRSQAVIAISGTEV
jgi:hypothetical protein